MRPEELVRLLNSMGTAADVVEALDSPDLQARRGWDLAGWGYGLVPWGARFVRRNGRGRITAAVVALAHPAGAGAYADAACPTTVVLLG